MDENDIVFSCRLVWCRTTQRQCKAQLAEGCGSALRSQADDIDPPIDCKLTVTSIEPPRATAVMPLHSVDFVTPDCHPTLNRRDERKISETKEWRLTGWLR